MTRDNLYQSGELGAFTVTFLDFNTFALGSTGLNFDQNGGISSIHSRIYPDSGRTSTAGAYALNTGINMKLQFYYDGPQVASSATLTSEGSSYSYAYWADTGLCTVYCSTGGGAYVSLEKPIEAAWHTGARVVPRDTWSDSSGRHKQRLYATMYGDDPNNFFAEWRGDFAIQTAGLPDPTDQTQPGRLWGISPGNTADAGTRPMFADAANYASGNTGISFPQEGGIKWLFASLRPNWAAGSTLGAQLGNMKIKGLLKFFYDGPQVASTSTVSIASETWNYAALKDVSVTMFCVTSDGNWQPLEFTDYNQEFIRPFRIVDREVHASGVQRIHIRMDYEDPWNLSAGKSHFGIAVATVKQDKYKNFKAS